MLCTTLVNEFSRENRIEPLTNMMMKAAAAEETEEINLVFHSRLKDNKHKIVSNQSS